MDELFARTFPFWESLSEQHRQIILSSAVKSVIAKGTSAHRSDSDCKGVMIVLTGQLRVYLLSEEGREVTLYRVHAGESCVQSAACLMDAIVFEVMIEAMEDTEIVTVPAMVFSSIVQSYPTAELYLYKTVTERFSDIIWIMQQILFMGADKRLAIFLWDEYSANGPEIRYTHDEIARLMGSAREVVTKMLKVFSSEGIVSLSRGKITIRDKEALRKLL